MDERRAEALIDGHTTRCTDRGQDTARIRRPGSSFSHLTLVRGEIIHQSDVTARPPQQCPRPPCLQFVSVSSHKRGKRDRQRYSLRNGSGRKIVKITWRQGTTLDQLGVQKLTDCTPPLFIPVLRCPCRELVLEQP